MRCARCPAAVAAWLNCWRPAVQRARVRVRHQSRWFPLPLQHVVQRVLPPNGLGGLLERAAAQAPSLKVLDSGMGRVAAVSGPLAAGCCPHPLTHTPLLWFAQVAADLEALGRQYGMRPLDHLAVAPDVLRGALEARRFPLAAAVLERSPAAAAHVPRCVQQAGSRPAALHSLAGRASSSGVSHAL